MSENGDASAPAPVVDRDLHPYSVQAFLNAIHLDDLSASRRMTRPRSAAASHQEPTTNHRSRHSRTNLPLPRNNIRHSAYENAIRPC